ncbi:MAG: nucleotidyltransferase family protein [Candidatus Lokiarchaeota archaeon]|nr:nucleotidyltransferase family protein [Candidatus Lokiarchaeota archaeon]
MLKEDIKVKIISILVKHGIKRILVFGSHARNEATPTSDLDLIVDFPEGTSLLDHVGIEIELSEALNMKIDLLSRNGISPYIKNHVLKEAIVIYE